MKDPRISGPENLTDQREFLRQVIDINPNLIFVKNRQGRFVLVNRAIAEVFDTTAENLVGKRDEDFNPNQEEVDHFRRDDLEVMDSLKEKLIPLEALTSKDGQVRYLQTIKRPLIDPDGVARHVLGVATDVTLLKESEQERRDLEAQVLHAQKLESLGILAGGIAHDFNNLLMGVMGYADLAQMELPADSPASQSIQHVQLAAQRAAELCKQLLDYSGKGRSVTEPVNLTETIEELHDLLKLTASRNSTLRFDLSRTLPVINADTTQIRQVIMNLVSNASDAIEGQNGVISVITGTMEVTPDNRFDLRTGHELDTGPHVYLEVSDNGGGMTPETIGKIFDPFFTTKFSGRGLGLAAVMGIVRAHGGGIQVESSLKRGTTFRVLFKADGQPVDRPLEPEGVAVVSRDHKTALVVDDEEMVRGVAQEILERIGFTVLTARTLNEGVLALERHADEIELILFDQVLLGDDTTAQSIQDAYPDIKVILMTDLAEPEVAPPGVRSIAGTLTKPFGVNDLMNCLSEIESKPPE